jgi:ABC-type lipoprotein export system ATPase subunit
VTAESFAAWKKRRAENKQKELEEKVKQAEVKSAKAKAMKGSKTHGVMNGRALFTYNPNLFQDDDNAGDADTYEEEKNQGDAPVDQSLFAADQGADEEVDFD